MKLHERIEFRLDTKTKRLLEELARSRGQSLGQTIRELLQKELDTLAPSPQDKRQAAQALVGLKLRRLPKPEDLQEEIARALAEG